MNLDPDAPNLLATVMSWHTEQVPEVRAVTKRPAGARLEEALAVGPLVRFGPQPGGTRTWAGDTTMILDADWYDTDMDVIQAAVKASVAALERLATRFHAGVLVDDCAVHLEPGTAKHENDQILRYYGAFRVTSRS
ncbi:hypothetical protein [Nocardiopsis sp. FR26]|uniref:hypothetical protein n=1 Tax=Nocardiopsis sp. FR26 TaxID=2605987 RepID=UPI00135B6461|nr:hypothetical protein [Nocardiopsis sp. FR26]